MDGTADRKLLFKRSNLLFVAQGSDRVMRKCAPKPCHYWVEILNKNDDRISLKLVLKTSLDLHEWCLGKLAYPGEAHRIQLWFGNADPDNPSFDSWVNSYCREYFEEWGQQALKNNRTSKVTRVTASGDRFVDITELPPVYSLIGQWHKPRVKTAKRRKVERLNFDIEVA